MAAIWTKDMKQRDAYWYYLNWYILDEVVLYWIFYITHSLSSFSQSGCFLNTFVRLSEREIVYDINFPLIHLFDIAMRALDGANK